MDKMTIAITQRTEVNLKFMADVYKGGIPNQGFNGTFPTSSSESGGFTPNAGPAEQKSSNGGPATFSGSSEEGFVNDGSYEGTGNKEMNSESMQVRDLDDIKSSV